MSGDGTPAGDLQAFLQQLRANGGLVEVDAEVDPRLEAAEIHRRVVAAGRGVLALPRPRGAAWCTDCARRSATPG